jgi:hypothetical protein
LTYTSTAPREWWVSCRAQGQNDRFFTLSAWGFDLATFWLLAQLSYPPGYLQPQGQVVDSQATRRQGLGFRWVLRWSGLGVGEGLVGGPGSGPRNSLRAAGLVERADRGYVGIFLLSFF